MSRENRKFSLTTAGEYLYKQKKAVYQDVCYPVTKDFRVKLYGELISSYKEAKDKVETVTQVQAQDKVSVNVGQPDRETPFR